MISNATISRHSLPVIWRMEYVLCAGMERSANGCHSKIGASGPSRLGKGFDPMEQGG